jgi:hypothetical protein
MHFITMIAAGLCLLLGFGFLGMLFGGGPGVAFAAKALLPVWLALSLANMWFAVTRMDSSWRDEMRRFLAIYLVPALAALFVWWKYSG